MTEATQMKQVKMLCAILNMIVIIKSIVKSFQTNAQYQLLKWFTFFLVTPLGSMFSRISGQNQHENIFFTLLYHPTQTSTDVYLV